MIIERHKVSAETGKLLDAAGLSHYATLELPEDELIKEARRQKAKGYTDAVIVAVAKKLYGGDRKISSEMA